MSPVPRTGLTVYSRRTVRRLAWGVAAGLGAALIPLAAAPAQAAGSVFISEYLEGSSNNKAIEIYNGTGAPIDLAAGGYQITMYFNGATTAATTINLSGTVGAADVHVVASAAASATVLAAADQTSTASFYNGDDAVVLRNAGGIIDVIGQIGFDPGTEWGTGLTSTADNTLARKPTSCSADPDGSDAFDPATQWDGFANDTFSGLGAHTATCGVVVDNPPSVTATIPTDGGSLTAAQNLSVTFSEPVQLSDGAFVLTCNGSPVSLAISGGPAVYTLDPTTELARGVSCTLTVVASSVRDLDGTPDPMAADVSVSASVSDPCLASFTAIPAIQGSGATAAITGAVTTQGVVVGDYEGPSPALRGFYLQDAIGDGDPATSDAIFVFNGNNNAVALGDVVRVSGTVSEFQDQTQLSASSITACGTGTVTATPVNLPFASATAPEALEGMLVSLPQTLYLTEYFQLGRFGEVVLSSSNRLRTATDVAEPGAPAQAVAAANALDKITLDDARNNQNPDPIVFSLDGNALSESNSPRGGDTITGAVGVMTYTWAGNNASGNRYRVRPVNALGGQWDFASANPRPSGPPSVGGTASVAGFNVLNCFSTLGAGLNCGPSGYTQNCRGANSALEFERQRAKLTAALGKLEADVIGLIELENTTGVEPLAQVVADLAAAGQPYQYVDTGTIGTDAIKVGIIYRPDRVTPTGDFAVLSSALNPRFDDDRNRPSLAQSFTSNEGEVFTVVVNHLKSKGCGDAAGADADQGDGQGCWNPVRVAAAQALADWATSDPTGVGDPDVFLLGDFNSYAMEEPIDAIKAAGFSDLGRDFNGASNYSYVFDGQWGYLDYAFASASVRPRVTGVGEYHINADEVPVLDYNTEFKSAAQVASLYAPNEFRTSDHDPVIVGFCDAIAPTATATATPNMLWPPDKRMVPVSVTVSATDASGPVSVRLVGVTSNEPTWNPKKGPDIVVNSDTSFSLRAVRSDSGTGRVYTITYEAKDSCANVSTFSVTVTVPIQLGG